MTLRVLTCLGLLSSVLMAAPVSLIIDTDVGGDDLMAIAFLLSRPDVHIEAFTVAKGLAHMQPGASNLLRLVQLSGHPEIPVYLGSDVPLQKTADFPDDWRKAADELAGVHLPSTQRRPEAGSAVSYLQKRLSDRSHPVSILALGALTNLARVFQNNPQTARNIQRLVIMGGALEAVGNLGDGGAFKTGNTTAEWNLFVDPRAAQIVFESGAPIYLVPLDATGKVPIAVEFLNEFQRQVHAKLGRFTAEVLESERTHIEHGYYQAWDPLAAVALVEPDALRWTPLAIDVRLKAPEEGRTVAQPGASPNAQVALDASRTEFERIFIAAFR